MAYDLNRQAMEEVIRNGGSVMVEGRIITRIEDLPGPASFVTTEEDKVKSAEELQAEIDRLNKQLSEVNAKSVTTEETKSEDTSKDKGTSFTLTPGKEGEAKK